MIHLQLYLISRLCLEEGIRVSNHSNLYSSFSKIKLFLTLIIGHVASGMGLQVSRKLSRSMFVCCNRVITLKTSSYNRTFFIHMITWSCSHLIFIILVWQQYICKLLKYDVLLLVLCFRTIMFLLFLIKQLVVECTLFWVWVHSQHNRR